MRPGSAPTLNRHPERLGVTIPDIRSRLRTVEIAPPGIRARWRPVRHSPGEADPARRKNSRLGPNWKTRLQTMTGPPLFGTGWAKTWLTEVHAASAIARSSINVFFRDELGLRFPRRQWGGAWDGKLIWGRFTHSRVIGILANPTYAGTYVFGRSQSCKHISPNGEICT
jgi:hypothetical protein